MDTSTSMVSPSVLPSAQCADSTPQIEKDNSNELSNSLVLSLIQAEVYSTLRMASSPFRKPVNAKIGFHRRRPPLPQILDRPPLPPRAGSVDSGMTKTCYTHNVDLQGPPDFNQRLENMSKQHSL